MLVLLLLFVALWRWRPGRLSAGALALRLLSAGLIVLAIADPVFLGPASAGGSTLVVLVDQSDSLGEEGKAALLDEAEGILAGSQPGAGPGADAHLIAFGGSVSIMPGVDEAGPSPSLQPEQSDIAGALRAAGGLIGARGGRIVLLSDGAQTRGDAMAEAQVLARRGIPVDAVPYVAPDRPEVWVQRVDVPATLRVGEEYSVDIVVGSNVGGTAQLELFEGGGQVEAQNIALEPGENPFSYRLVARQPGIARIQVTVAAQPDSLARNNSAAATALVAEPPRVLLVEGSGGAGNELRTALRDAGVETDAIQAGSVPTQLSQLDAYEGAVLLDVAAGDLSTDQMATLREFVRSEGRGLVATGGRSSFTLGAYKGTPLEEALPVLMEPPPKPQRSDVTLLLIIDRSASMGVPETPTKFDMAKESAILATEELRDEDRVGVLTFDTSQEWTVAFQQIGSGLTTAEIQERISALSLGGGTDIYEALNVGMNALASQPGEVRHAVLLTDGRSFTTTRGPYEALIERMRALDITLSSIAIGEDADIDLLQDLAQWGAGRYHFAGSPEDIPRLTLLESEIARTEPQVEGEFRADLAAPHPLLRDFSSSRIPSLQGYVATTIKPEAELVLRSPEEDPVLAVWQYGLGRAVAWTPSVEAPWAQSWANWPEYGAFWAQIIRYTLPEPDSGPLQVRVTPGRTRAAEATISADSLAPSGAPLDLADTEATITLPDGSTRSVTLRQTAPGHYEQTVALPSDGPYAVVVRQRKEDLDRSASTGYAQPYPPEYLPGQDGTALLRRIVEAGGGQLLGGGVGPLGAGSAPAAERHGLWLWLLLAAALLWPAEIALRRGWLSLRR